MLVVVTGTATGIGKTWVGAAVVRALRERGVEVHARKPVQSFAAGDDTSGLTDAHVLAGASGEDVHTVCPAPGWLRVALAPPMAADVLGRRSPSIADLVGAIGAVPPRAVTMVEGAGGPRSPIASDGDTIDLAMRLAADLVVLVADAGLGTINAVRLCAAALDDFPLVVVLNRFDAREDLHVRNLDWLRTREGLEVVTDLEALVDRLATGATR